MNADDFIKIGGWLIGALGGGSVIVLGLSGWLGKVWADRILEKEKKKYNEELEQIKTKLQLQLETTKSVVLRYSENQFLRYNDLWTALCKLKVAGENLWDAANRTNLSAFAKELSKADAKVDESVLFLEEDHFQQLKQLFGEFRNFQIGKRYLMELRSPNVLRDEINEIEIQNLIHTNGQTRDRYVSLLHRLSREFKNQIKGGGPL